MTAFAVAVSMLASIIVSVSEWSRPGIQSTPTSKNVIRLGSGARVAVGTAVCACVGPVFASGWRDDPFSGVELAADVDGDGDGDPRPRKSLFWIETLVSYHAQVPTATRP